MFEKQDVPQPAGATRTTMRDVIAWVRRSLLKERPELFMSGDSV